LVSYQEWRGRSVFKRVLEQVLAPFRSQL